MTIKKAILFLTTMLLFLTSFASAHTITYEYDSRNRLERATYVDGTIIEYTYDHIGNRLSMVITNPDTDGDGMPDIWEMQYFGTLDRDGTGDYDNDGISDLDEYLNGTNPAQDTQPPVITATPAGGLYNSAQAVILSMDEPGDIYYTLDGTDPTPSCTLYQTPIQITNTTTLKALAVDTAGNPSTILEETYTIQLAISVEVATSTGRFLENIHVYAFTAANTYTGLHAVTDAQGIAIFNVNDFADGDYIFRADYLADQFWSDTLIVPGDYTAQVMIQEEMAEITVTMAGDVIAGVRVYLFDENGTYFGIYGTTDVNGQVTFILPVGHFYTFRADYMGSQYWSSTTEITSGGTIPVAIPTGGGALTVTVAKDAANPLEALTLYLFTASGTYLGMNGQSDPNGQVSFQVPAGDYMVRADYMGYPFWTNVVGVFGNTNYDLMIPHQDVTITVERDYNGDIQPMQGRNVYLFTESGSYLGLFQITDAQGQVVFNLPEQAYQVRTDYLTQQYWSSTFTWTDETVTIDEGMAEIMVTNMGMPLQGISVYVFTATGSYLGIQGVSDLNGLISFRLPQGDYNFRADYMGSQYWSGVNTVIGHVNNPVTVSTGGGSFVLSVLRDVSDPMASINCYLFTASGTYLSEQRVTDTKGQAGFNLADGDYQIRMDYLGYQYWTPVFNVPASSDMDYFIPHQDVTITVEGDYNGDIQVRQGLSTYLFTSSGAYMGQSQATDFQGQVVFNLPEQEYQVRADYLTQQYWSAPFTWMDETITVDEGMAEVQVSQGTTPLANVNVYVYTASGTYLGINTHTDTNGIAAFRLPEGTYTFRADYQASQYWATQTVNAHMTNIINLNTGGGTFVLTVEKGPADPMVGLPVYLFNGSGTYLGVSADTDAQGQVSFDLSNGDYRFRADYLGYPFWSNVSTVPTTLANTLLIPHQDVTIAVNQVYGSSVTPLNNVRVYLFNGAGSYMGKFLNTDTLGQVTFNLPQETYKMRADYMSSQYWSGDFIWVDEYVDIDHGQADIHVTLNGADVFDAPVYLFTDTGSYLGQYERTDTLGYATFLIPAKAYMFRVDYNGTQYWSNVVDVLPSGVTNVEVSLD